MFDCPSCGTPTSLAYNISLDVYTCIHCRLSFDELDEDTVDDYLFENDHYELVSSHVVPKYEPTTNELDVERLEFMKKEYNHRSQGSAAKPADKNAKRASRKPKHGEESKGSK